MAVVVGVGVVEFFVVGVVRGFQVVKLVNKI